MSFVFVLAFQCFGLPFLNLFLVIMVATSILTYEIFHKSFERHILHLNTKRSLYTKIRHISFIKRNTQKVKTYKGTLKNKITCNPFLLECFWQFPLHHYYCEACLVIYKSFAANIKWSKLPVSDLSTVTHKHNYPINIIVTRTSTCYKYLVHPYRHFREIQVF